MKLVNLIVVLLVGSAVSQLLAANEAKTPHPCAQIKQACEAAGFKKGDHKDKKGLYLDCMQPLMNGQTVTGVTVDAAVVTACKAKKAERAH